ncbi:hypothetical protein QTJ16_004281 [Diplocarpon rosae]|uniref:Endo-chitosanase n=1 Tax=Diplocarpon rosae TaxID=946125 RepID=A0AAD9SZW5_9HELO|nr:hypothetical protein QTJ16_004281 [Diplocarpon rosae]
MHFASLTMILSILTFLALQAAARDVPPNIQAFYDSVKRDGSCSRVLQGGFAAKGSTAENTFSYCGSRLRDGVVYISGERGQMADMDVDCDGTQRPRLGDDGRCGTSSDTQSMTSFRGDVGSYGRSIQDLNAFVHPYVVFGNSASRDLPGYVQYDPWGDGVHPLSVVATVCGNGKMFYGIWGDVNGDDAPKAIIGEASISMATLCFGTDVINGGAGHDQTDVLYLAFTGKDALPGAQGAKWDAHTPEEFEESIAALGGRLASRIGMEATVPTMTATAALSESSSTSATTLMTRASAAS